MTDAQRELEEDPATDTIAEIGSTRVAVHTSRFQVDLNRPRPRAIYLTPEDAWGLRVWREPLADELRDASLAEYDRFYAAMHELIDRTIAKHGHALVLDVHSYNHRRGSSDAPAASQVENPDINVGTAGLDRSRWGAVAESFVDSLSRAGYDTRENVKFEGGAFVHWVHATFPGTACALAVEFKKTFMDEWTGQVDADRARTRSRGTACGGIRG